MFQCQKLLKELLSKLKDLNSWTSDELDYFKPTHLRYFRMQHCVTLVGHMQKFSKLFPHIP